MKAYSIDFKEILSPAPRCRKNFLTKVAKKQQKNLQGPEIVVPLQSRYEITGKNS